MYRSKLCICRGIPYICIYSISRPYIYKHTTYTVLKAFDAAVCMTRPDIRLQTEVPCRTFVAPKPRRLKETASPHSPEHWELWKCK